MARHRYPKNVILFGCAGGGLSLTKSHNQLFETVYLNCLVHFSPVTIPVHRRLWNMEEGGVLSVECGV